MVKTDTNSFYFLLLAQIISLLGSHLTGFVLGLWVLKTTGSVTSFALINFASLMPEILFSSVFGVLVDRWNPRRALVLGHAGAGICMLLLAMQYIFGTIDVWQIILWVALGSVFNAFLFPAFSAATTALVPFDQLNRAQGGIQFGISLIQIAAPALAGFLLLKIGMEGIFFLDVATFVIAVIITLAIRIPSVARDTMRQQENSVLNQMTYGWKYIQRRPGFLWLLLLQTVVNFNIGIVWVLFTPMVLNFADTAVLGSVLSIAGAGMLLGSLFMIAWNCPQRQVYGVLVFTMIMGTGFVLASVQPSVPLVTVASFIVLFAFPIIRSCDQVIWQRKVAPEIQGKIFGFRATISGISIPVAYLVAGPLADHVFEPLMADGGPLASTLGQILGVGPGRGIALMFSAVGCLTIISVVLAYFYPPIRFIEDEVPDHVYEGTEVEAIHEELVDL